MTWMTAGALFCGGHTPLCTTTWYCISWVNPTTSYTLSRSGGEKAVHAVPSGEDCQFTGFPTCPVRVSNASLVCCRQNCMLAGLNAPPTVKGSTNTVAPVAVSMLQDSPFWTTA